MPEVCMGVKREARCAGVKITTPYLHNAQSRVRWLKNVSVDHVCRCVPLVGVWRIDGLTD